MTLDEAIKHVEEIAEENEYNAQICHKILKDRLADFRDLQAENNFIKCAEEYRQLAELLKELKQLRKQTRWIPVSERMPDLDDVLVYDGSDIFVAWWVNDGIDAGWHSFDGSYNPYTPILAWMPLPKPYKAESEDKE